MKIAVIGGGISGLSAAYLLSKEYKVDLYEKENRFGGHARTTMVQEEGKEFGSIRDFWCLTIQPIHF